MIMWRSRKKHGRSTGFEAISRIIDAEMMKDLIVVETGTLRNDGPSYLAGDGWSTVFFRTLIDKIGGELHSVDINEDHVQVSKRVIEARFGNLKNTFHYCEDSVSFLRRFSKRIDLLYLDSMDYSGDDSAARHQLCEIQACIDNVADNGIIIVDDIYENLDHGKPAHSIPFMREQGWTEITLLNIPERRRAQWFQAIIRKPSHMRG